MEAIMTIIEVIVAGLIGVLFLFMVYRIGHSAGFDDGVRSDARCFYFKDDETKKG